MRKSHLIVLLILLFLLGLALGYLLGARGGGEVGAPISRKEIKQELLQKLEERGVLPPEPEKVTSVSGKVTQVGKDYLMLELEPAMWDPFGDVMPEKVKVNIDQDTKIEMLQEKSPEQLQKEEAAFEEKMQAYENKGEAMPADVMPPEPFQRKKVSLSAIKKGTQVSVTSEENIKAKQTIQAKTIEFSQSLASTGP